MKNLREKLNTFFLTPSNGKRLATFRIGVGLVLLAQALMVIPDFYEFYGSSALIQASLNQMYSHFIPSSTQFAMELGPLFGNVNSILVTMGVLYLVSLVSLTLGFFTGISAVFAWALHTMFLQSHGTAYGADTYAHISLFYLMVTPSGLAYSLDAIRKKTSNVETSTATLGLRVIQLHIGFSYLVSAIEKAQGIQWWNGEVIWRSLQLPVYAQTDFFWLHHVAFLLPILSIGTLVLEAGYLFFMFWPKTRNYWLAGMVSLHLGIAAFLGLHIFGFIMTVISVTLFGPKPNLSFSVAPFTLRRRPKVVNEALNVAT